MRKAFTLIELLIVIAIIGILAGILFVSIGTNPLQKSRDSKRVADMQNLRTALSLFYSDTQKYPTVAEFTTGSAFIGKYVPALPNDPSASAITDTPNCGVTFTPNFGGTATLGAHGYLYQVDAASPAKYVLTACLEKNDNKILATDCDNTTYLTASTGCYADGGGAGSGLTLFDVAG